MIKYEEDLSLSLRTIAHRTLALDVAPRLRFVMQCFCAHNSSGPSGCFIFRISSRHAKPA